MENFSFFFKRKVFHFINSKCYSDIYSSTTLQRQYTQKITQKEGFKSLLDFIIHRKASAKRLSIHDGKTLLGGWCKLCIFVQQKELVSSDARMSFAKERLWHRTYHKLLLKSHKAHLSRKLHSFRCAAAYLSKRQILCCGILYRVHQEVRQIP